MELAAIVEFVSAVVLTIGVIFAAIQIRYFRVARKREAALELLHSFQTADFNRALHLLLKLPPELSKAEIEERVGDDMGLLYALMATWESLGVLVHRGEIGLDLVDDFFSGPIVISWRILQNFVRDQRQELGRETAAEWFQWLAERIMAGELAHPPVPAYIAHRDWQPKD